MAKVKWSALVTGMRNKLNGSVASHNRYGDYWRNKTTPVNPRTQFQQNVRAAMATNARDWRALSADNRASWNGAAPSRPFTDIWGDKLIYSGFNLFMKVNQAAANFGTAKFTQAPPNEPAPDDIRGILVEEASGVVTVGVTNDVTDGQMLIVYGAANYSAGKSYTKNLQKLLGVFTTATPPIQINAALEARFGSLIPGTGIVIRAAAWSPNSGLLGIPYQGQIIFTAP